MNKLTKEQQALLDKHQKIFELLLEAVPFTLHQFFDFDSDKNLDEKIEIFTAMKNGKSLAEIPNIRLALEFYPEDGVMWD